MIKGIESLKTLLNLKYKLMSDKKSAEIADRTLRLQYEAALMNAEQKQSQYESDMAYRQDRDKINENILSFSKLLYISDLKVFHLYIQL